MKRAQVHTYCTPADAVAVGKSLIDYLRRPKNVDWFVEEALSEIETMTQKAERRLLNHPTCKKYLFVRINNAADKISFFECDDTANLFIVLPGNQRFYLNPNCVEARTLRATTKVPNKALYRTPYRNKLRAALEERGFKEIECTDSIQLVIDLYDKYNMGS